MVKQSDFNVNTTPVEEAKVIASAIPNETIQSTSQVNRTDPPQENMETPFEPTDELLTYGPGEMGPYWPALFTNGGEFWVSNLQINLETLRGDSNAMTLQDVLNNNNSYVGPYHIRNYGTIYQTIVPTGEATDEYSGPVMYSRPTWLEKYGFPSLAQEAELASNLRHIKGCKNPQAVNYNPLAESDDGSCVIVHNWLLGEVPAQGIDNLYTRGGELYFADTGADYQGYYHVHGADVHSINEEIVPGAIMSGQVYYISEDQVPPGQANNKLLLPYTAYEMVSYTQLLPETPEIWNIVHNSTTTDSLEDQNILDIDSESVAVQIETLDETIQGQEMLIIDNKISVPEPVNIMENAVFEFLDDELRELDDIYSPGIFGTKPKLQGDLNILELSQPPSGNATSGKSEGV